VDYQDVRIIVLNSNDLLEEQTEYVRKQLESSKAKWNILTCHHSIFAPAVGRDFQFARENWKPLLDKYNVDLVLNGHDHTYARGHVPFRFAEKGPSEDLGTIYVTSVSGPKQYDLDKDQLEGYGVQGYQLDQTGDYTQFYQVITVEGNKLTYVAYNALGEEHDRVVIKKNFKSGKKKLVD